MKILKLILVAIFVFVTLNGCYFRSSKEADYYGYAPYGLDENGYPRVLSPNYYGPNNRASRSRANSGTGASTISNGGGTSVGQ